MKALVLLAALACSASAYDKEGGAPTPSTAAVTAPVPSTATASTAPFAAIVPAEAGAPSAAPSARPFLRFGRAQLLGSRGYVGSSNLLEAAVSSWSVRAGYRDYSLGGSTGTFYTFSGRGGWTDGRISVGVLGEVTPRNAGYASRAFGGDFGWGWRPPARKGAVKRVELGVSLVRFSHSTDLSATGGQPVQTVDVGQSDLAASAGVGVWNASFSAGVKKSVYNLDGSDLAKSTSRVLTLSNFDAVVSGFPQDEWWLRASFDRVLWGLTPSASWTRTVYKNGQRPTVAAQAGLAREFRRWGASAFYGRLSEPGQADRSFAGLGAEAKFF